MFYGAKFTYFENKNLFGFLNKCLVLETCQILYFKSINMSVGLQICHLFPTKRYLPCNISESS